jgi:hypothetical protein
MVEERDQCSLADHLTPWVGAGHPEDPNARFKEEVALFSRIDPLPSLRVLAEGTGVPVGGLLRFIATKYLTAGSETLLAVGAAQVEDLLAETDRAEAIGTTEARLRAYWNLRGRIRWLAAGLDPPDPRAPWGSPDHAV